MKKIFASIGLVTFAAVNSQGQPTADLTPQQTSKPWTVSADLRGFYDDNYVTLPKNVPNPTPGVGGGAFIRGKRSAFGIEFSPSAGLNFVWPEDHLSASYQYDLRYFAGAPNTTDQQHEFNLKETHDFSQRTKLQLAESFAIFQEPGVPDPTIVSSPLRTPGNNIHNTASADITQELSPVFDLHAGYANTFYAYKQGLDEEPNFPAAPAASRRGELDRMEHLGTLDLRWKVEPATTALLGYQYEKVDYTSKEQIIFGTPTAVFANSRNSDNHFVFLGVDESFTPQLNASLRVGGQYVDYYKAVPNHTSKLSPYVDGSLTYQYMQGSYVQVGVKNIHTATDVVGNGGLAGNAPVLDAQATAVYVNLTHQIASRVTLNVLGQYQNSRFDSGQYAKNSEDFFIAGINAAYHFNPFLQFEVGYDYNRLESDIAFRGYSRNQVYFGVRGSY